MQVRTVWVVVAGVSLLVLSSLAKPHPVPGPHGTSILHYLVRKTMVNQGLMTNAVGRVEAQRNQQGNADNQHLDVRVARLETNATYQLLALTGDDTNYTLIAQFNTDRKGAAELRYRQVGSRNGNGGGKNNGHGNALGRGKRPLPAGLNPVEIIREVVVADGGSQAVLVADLTAPDKFEYLIRRWLGNDGVETNAAAEFRLHANTNVLQFRLRGSGLAPGLSYLLAVNSGVLDAGIADADGKLSFTNLPISPVAALAVRTIAIWNSASNSVLSTQLR